VLKADSKWFEYIEKTKESVSAVRYTVSSNDTNFFQTFSKRYDTKLFTGKSVFLKAIQFFKMVFD